MQFDAEARDQLYQQGYAIATISLKAIGAVPGDASAEQMRIVADIAEEFGHDEIRISHEQNIVLPHVGDASEGIASIAKTAPIIATFFAMKVIIALSNHIVVLLSCTIQRMPAPVLGGGRPLLPLTCGGCKPPLLQG